MNVYENRLHSAHLYVRIEESEAQDIPAARFEELAARYGRPLEAIVPSNPLRVIGLLREAGFLLKRRCYEMQVTPSDLALPLSGRLRPVAEA